MEGNKLEPGGPEPRWQAVGSWTDDQEALSEPLNSLCEQLPTAHCPT